VKRTHSTDQEGAMGIFDRDDKDDKPKANFSDVRSGSSSSAPEPATPRLEVERTITVQAGDSLSKIAKREYGDAQKWHAIYAANRDKIKDPDLIYPGQELTLPADVSRGKPI
jgi:nucleoid-associated protein YgaU